MVSVSPQSSRPIRKRWRRFDATDLFVAGGVYVIIGPKDAHVYASNPGIPTGAPRRGGHGTRASSFCIPPSPDCC
jgi:hypothetical protein